MDDDTPPVEDIHTDQETGQEDVISSDQEISSDPSVSPDVQKENVSEPKEQTILSKVESILGIGKKDNKDGDDKPPLEGLSNDPVVSDKGVASDKDTPPAADDSEGDPVVPQEIADHPAYKKLQEENQIYADSHNRLTQIQDFMQKNDLQSNDMASAMNVAAVRKLSGVPFTEFEQADKMAILAHTNPEEFYNKLSAMADEYGVFLGKKLPADIEKDVAEGHISEERAKELAEARIQKKISDRKAETASQRMSANDAERQTETREVLVDNWFEKASRKDPELKHKVNAIEGELLRLIAQRQRDGKAPANNEKDVFSLLDEAHKNVTKTMRLGRQKAPVDPAPRSNPAPVVVDEHKDKSPEERLVDDVYTIMNKQAG